MIEEFEPSPSSFISKEALSRINATIPSNMMEIENSAGGHHQLFDIPKVESHDNRPAAVIEEEINNAKSDEFTLNAILNEISIEARDFSLIWKNCFRDKGKAKAFYDILCHASHEKVHLYQEDMMAFSSITVSPVK